MQRTVALVRERARLRARPPVIGCVPAGVKVLGARIDWGDGTSTPVAVEQRAQAAQIVLLSRGRAPLRPRELSGLAAAALPMPRGYRMVLVADLSDGATVESEPVDVSVLAAADRVVDRRGQRRPAISSRSPRGWSAAASAARAELTVTVAWGDTQRTVVHLHGTERTSVFTARHLRRGKGPRYVTVTVRDRLGLTETSATRILRA